MAIAAQCLALEPKKTRLGMAGTPRSGALAEFVRPVSLQRAVLKTLPFGACAARLPIRRAKPGAGLSSLVPAAGDFLAGELKAL